MMNKSKAGMEEEKQGRQGRNVHRDPVGDVKGRGLF